MKKIPTLFEREFDERGKLKRVLETPIVAEEIVVDDNEWGNNQNAFPEIACRKLFKLCIVSKDGKMWHYEPPKEE